MKDEFTNRLHAFRTTLNYLLMPEQRPTWEGKTPVRFTTLTTQAVGAVEDLADFCQKQSASIKGAAMDKAREEKELEDAAFTLGQAVGECCGALGNETDAMKCAFPLSKWQGMRDAALLANAREVVRIAQETLAAHPVEAAECGITEAAIQACASEVDDFQRVLTSPQQAIATRKAHTALLRDRFNEVESIFTRMDALIGQFPDATFVHGYRAARTVRDLGHGPGTPPTSAPPPAP